MKEVLDTIEQLVATARRPDIDRVDRYGPEPQGVIVAYRSGAKAFLWPTREPCQPVSWPDQMPDDRFPAQHALRLVADLLRNSSPTGWRWQPMAISGVHLTPAALQIQVGDSAVVIRAVSSSPAGRG